MVKVDFNIVEMNGHVSMIMTELTEALLDLRHLLVKDMGEKAADQMMSELFRTYDRDKKIHTPNPRGAREISMDASPGELVDLLFKVYGGMI